MRMIYVGTLATEPDRDTGWMREFANLGWEVIPSSSQFTTTGGRLLSKVQRRFNIGPGNRIMQQTFLNLVRDQQPSWIHFRLPIEFSRSTIQALQDRGVIVTQYFNDDPFSPRTPFGLHWKFRQALSAYDGHFVFRAHNVDAYHQAGALHVFHCPPTYDPSEHTLEQRLSDGSFLADAAFIGHWENDDRMGYLEALQSSGLTLILKGGFWDDAIKNRPLGILAPVGHAFGDDYKRIYSNVIAGLCFFSKINRDTWTRRALEIVAVGGVLVCERTAEAESYFRDRKEACFFSSSDELISIVQQLKSDLPMRDKIQKAGYARLLSGRHSLRDRAQQINSFVLSRLAHLSVNNSSF